MSFRDNCVNTPSNAREYGANVFHESWAKILGGTRAGPVSSARGRDPIEAPNISADMSSWMPVYAEFEVRPSFAGANNCSGLHKIANTLNCSCEACQQAKSVSKWGQRYEMTVSLPLCTATCFGLCYKRLSLHLLRSFTRPSCCANSIV